MSEETDTTTEDLDINDDEAQALLADALSSDTDSDTESDNAERHAELETLREEVTKWKSLARKHEGTAKQRSEAASKAQSLQKQVEDLRKQMADQETASTKRNGRLAMSQVHTKLASSGVKPDDVKGVLGRIDPSVLLGKDGEPDDDAVTELAESLTKIAGRVTPDPDQGRKGGTAAPNMNDLIRRAAGMRIN